MAKVECSSCKKLDEKAYCGECLLKTVTELQTALNTIKSLESKISKMNEFMSAFNELNKIKEKL